MVTGRVHCLRAVIAHEQDREGVELVPTAIDYRERVVLLMVVADQDAVWRRHLARDRRNVGTMLAPSS